DSSAFTYALSGVDSALFNMAGTTLAFITAPDFEVPQDNGTDNVYNVSVTANDGDNDSAAAAFTVTVKNTNDVIPRITNAATLSVPEQTTAVTTITVADADSTVFTYRISGGEDSAFFNLTGADLAFANSPDFLNPLDANSDNVYRVDVIVNDGANDSVAMAFAVTVTGIGGPRWRGEKLIETDDAGAASAPQVALDTNGNAIAVWAQNDGTRNNIWANRYVVGSGWGNAELIETDDKGNASDPQITLDANGNALAVWAQSDGTRANIWANRYVVGNGWGKAELVETDNTGSATGPQIALDANGNAMAVWVQNDATRSSIWANRYVVGNGWGTAEFIIARSAASGFPQIAMDAKGNALAVWMWAQDEGTGISIWANHYVAGTGWGAAELIDTGGTLSSGWPQIAMDAKGNALAMWFQDDGTGFNILANRYEVGSGWGSAELIDTGGRWPQIAMDANGNALAVWTQNDGTRSNIWANRYLVGSGWDTSELIETGNEGDVWMPQIAVDANGNAQAVWVQFGGTRRSIWANRYVAGSGWGTAGIIETDNVEDAWSPQIALDAEGNALAVWSQGSNIWANRFE
ncbi:hypothetical protein MNBD_GAMMA20-727, partial [hydrothermal vent metagenome]